MKVSFLSRDPDKVFVWIGNNSHYFTFRGPLMSKSIQILEGLACSLPRRSVRSSESALCLIRKYAKTVKQSGMTAWIIQAARVKMCLSLVVNPCVPYLTARRLSIRSMERSTETVLHQSKHGPPSSSQIGEEAQRWTRSQHGWILVKSFGLSKWRFDKLSVNKSLHEWKD